MPPSSHKQPPEIPIRTRLLEIAQRAALFLSPDNQPYVACPLATPLYSESFFAWFIAETEQRLGSVPSGHQVAYVVRTLNAQANASKIFATPHRRIAKLPHGKYQLDLGTTDHQVINITGKDWSLSDQCDAYFERLNDNQDLPTPERTKLMLAECLQPIFKITRENAVKLALWLAQALLPGQPPPILIITGTAREAAIEKLRNLIDPVTCPIIETPYSRRELPRMALENKVLAFVFDEALTEKMILGFKAFHAGTRVRLRHHNKAGEKLRTTIHRPILIASSVPQQISPDQITIEINSAESTLQSKVFGALLDLLVAIIGIPAQITEPLVLSEPGEMLPTIEETPHPDTS